MASVTRVIPLTRAARRHLPAPCVDCTFWQHPTRATDARAKSRWAATAEAEHGSWGRILLEGNHFRGLVQYAPAPSFPRGRSLPAGPASADAGLIACTFLAPEDPVGSCERLMLEALADLKARGLSAAEAFALGYPDQVPIDERFVGHHTLLDREFLGGLGFTPARRCGQVALMRLNLASLAHAPTRASHFVRRFLPGRPRPRAAPA